MTQFSLDKSSPQDLLDSVADAVYYDQCTGVIVYENSLCKDFFDLKSGIAGEILQKCSTYGIKIVIIGDFKKFSSKSLKAFINESNQGNAVYFTHDMEEGIKVISRSKHR